MFAFTNVQNNQRSTVSGMIAILFWGTTIAFSRSLTEQLGTLTAAALIYLGAGLFGLALMLTRPGWFAGLRQLPAKYILGCGGLFVIYIVSLYLAVGWASSRVEVLTVGLINYLWPGLSLLLSIPILGNRGKALLPVGILIALVGVWLATVSVDGVSAGDLVQKDSNWGSYLLAMVAAMSWALYSNLSRRWAGGKDGSAVPLFLLASGAILQLMVFWKPEISRWSLQAGVELVYMAVFPGMLAYVLWDIAVRNGNIILVAALSYATPLLSTIISAFVLKVIPGPGLWLGALLVFAGAIICKFSIRDKLSLPQT